MEGPILVIGAGGAVGRKAVRALRARNMDVVATWRTHRPETVTELEELGATTKHLDLTDRENTRRLVEEAAAVLFIPILTASAAAARHLKPHKPAVFFSSNNVAIDFEAKVYEKLREAETETRKSAPHAVILRPTMIYGYPGDGNLSRLMSFMKRSPVTPMPGRGSALQQPAYYADLAHAAVDALFDENRHGGTCAVAGPEPVMLKEMYRAAKAAAGANTAIVSLPTMAAGKTIQLLEKAGLKLPVKSAQLLRAERDKIPQGDTIILTQTGLQEGLQKLAAAMSE